MYPSVIKEISIISTALKSIIKEIFILLQSGDKLLVAETIFVFIAVVWRV